MLTLSSSWLERWEQLCFCTFRGIHSVLNYFSLDLQRVQLLSWHSQCFQIDVKACKVFLNCFSWHSKCAQLLFMAFTVHTQLLFRPCGASVLSGLSPTMPTSTLATGTIHQTNCSIALKQPFIQIIKGMRSILKAFSPMFRSKHGGWRVHKSKPSTMPDNPNYPKKVFFSQ